MAHNYVIRRKVDKSGPVEKVRYYAVSKTTQCITTRKIAKNISTAASATEGDVLAVLSALSWSIREALQAGHTVVLDGIGTFSLSATSKGVDHPDELTARDVRPKRICFKADRGLWKELELTRMVLIK